MTLSVDILRRLAFIRYLYFQAFNQSHQPEPLLYSSILVFHDAVELFLQLAAEKYNVGSTKKTEFMTYFDLLERADPPMALTQKESIKRLSSARVELKHNGTWPSKIAVEGFRASVTNFFQENVALVFNEKFDSISLLNIVQHSETKQLLELAQDFLGKDSLDEALNIIAAAFITLLEDYENRNCGRWGDSPFIFGGKIDFESSFSMGIEDRKLSTVVDKITKSIVSMNKAFNDAMKIISLGLDYRRYAKFKMYTPSAERNNDGTFRFWGRYLTPSKPDCQSCLDFVIECALKLQEFDFEIERR